MKLWCKLGIHHFAQSEWSESTVISSHENAKSIQEHDGYVYQRYKCLFCSKVVNQPLSLRRTFHNVLYVNAPLDKVKGEIKNEQVSKVVPQEVKVKPTQYKEPKP